MKRTALAAPLVTVLWTGASDAADAGAQRRQLQIEQLQDTLNLSLQQGLQSRRYELSPTDARRLDQLHLDQRLQQHQLQQNQLQREYQTSRDPALPAGTLNHRSSIQRDAFALERQLQVQQFHEDGERLIQSVPREPLQPPIGQPQLGLP